jgi:hypothetical protein
MQTSQIHSMRKNLATYVVQIPGEKVPQHPLTRDSLNNCVLIETKYPSIIEEISAQVQMLLFIIPFW